MRAGPFLAAFLLAGLTASAPGAELYGRPLRGLTPVPIAELQRKAADYDGRTVRVKGEVRSERGAFRLVEGDFRDPALLESEPPFDLVLGAPPYFERGTATEARHPQAVPARITLRGGIGAYAEAARRTLAPGGRLAFVWPVARDAEARAALRREDLLLLARRDVVFREGEPPLVALYAAARAGDLPASLATAAGFPRAEPPLVVRRADGRHTPEYASVRLSMGFPPGDLAPRPVA